MKNCETVGITSMLGMNSMQMFESKKGLSVVNNCKFYSLGNGLNNMNLFERVIYVIVSLSIIFLFCFSWKIWNWFV